MTSETRARRSHVHTVGAEQHNGHHTQPNAHIGARAEELILRLQSIVDSQAFYDTLEMVLAEVRNPTDLARCAELAGRREPGGPYYRAKLWARAEEVREEIEGKYPR